MRSASAVADVDLEVHRRDAAGLDAKRSRDANLRAVRVGPDTTRREWIEFPPDGLVPTKDDVVAGGNGAELESSRRNRSPSRERRDVEPWAVEHVEPGAVGPPHAARHAVPPRLPPA